MALGGLIIVGVLIGTAPMPHLLAADAGSATRSGARPVARVEAIVIQSSPEAGGKCVDVRNQQFVQGMPLQTWPCNDTPAQIFSYEISEGRLTIGGLCVDAWGGKGQSGDPLRLYPCNGGANQTWSLKQNKNYLKFVGINGLCIDIREGDLVLATCGEAASQNWVVRSAKVP